MAHIAEKDKKFLKGAFGVAYTVALLTATGPTLAATGVVIGVGIAGILVVRAVQ